MVISKTPLRISFVGGGTDLASYYTKHSGKVISTAINKYIYVIVKKRIDKLIVLHYTKNEIVESVDEIKHEIIRECMKMVGIENGIEIITLSDITTLGSGLGSSSVLTVGLLNALYSFKGKLMNNFQLAEKACEIEINNLKKPIGKQDQYIAAFGGIHKFIFQQDETVTVSEVIIEKSKKIVLKKNIFLFNTNITRKADNILSLQNANTEQNLNNLHIISNLVDRLENHFWSGDIDDLGTVLKINWDIKKNLANGISNPDIDNMVNKALNGGASGCKIAGAGGGGYLICYVIPSNHISFLQSMSEYNLIDFDLEEQGTKIVFNLI